MIPCKPAVQSSARTEAGLVSIPYEFNQPVGTLPNFALGN